MIDCDPTHPLNQNRNWKPWEPKKKRKKKIDAEFKPRTRLQKVRLLWARQNELSRL